ncbi:hypothetical protein GOACH_19_01060, partial [Gordonia aichiensis NBRC 108223]
MATAPSSVVAHHRARVGALSRDRQPDDPALAEARQDLKAATLESYVAKVLAQAPPLTSEQRERIAALLRVGPRPQADHADLGLVDVDHDA